MNNTLIRYLYNNTSRFKVTWDNDINTDKDIMLIKAPKSNMTFLNLLFPITQGIVKVLGSFHSPGITTAGFSISVETFFPMLTFSFP